MGAMASQITSLTIVLLSQCTGLIRVKYTASLVKLCEPGCCVLLWFAKYLDSSVCVIVHSDCVQSCSSPSMVCVASMLFGLTVCNHCHITCADLHIGHGGPLRMVYVTKTIQLNQCHLTVLILHAPDSAFVPTGSIYIQLEINVLSVSRSMGLTDLTAYIGIICHHALQTEIVFGQNQLISKDLTTAFRGLDGGRIFMKDYTFCKLYHYIPNAQDLPVISGRAAQF